MPLFWKKRPVALASFEDVQREIDILKSDLACVQDEAKALRGALEGAVQNVGIIRFNPFREIGGDQSFSLALLNGKGSGVVVTSHYGRDMHRVYAKPVIEGRSPNTLSKEEEEAIARALKPEDRPERPNGNGKTKKK